MPWNPDLSARWIFVKAALFAGILAMSVMLVILEDRRMLRALFVLPIIWSSARLYYFMFYVIERYIDPGYKFAGVWDCLQYLLKRRKRH